MPEAVRRLLAAATRLAFWAAGELGAVAMKPPWLSLLPSVALSQAVDCTAPFVTEAQKRCPTEAQCVLITWALNGMPAQCRLVNGSLVWWVGLPTTGTTIDPSSGQLIVTYTWVPFTGQHLPKAPSEFVVK
jgi:hypothetical protein